VALKCNKREELEIEVRVYQGYVVSTLLIIIIFEVLSREYQEGLPWEFLNMNDLVVMIKSKQN